MELQNKHSLAEVGPLAAIVEFTSLLQIFLNRLSGIVYSEIKTGWSRPLAHS